jgi:NO-binding membrane sensor protein with MHYT domain
LVSFGSGLSPGPIAELGSVRNPFGLEGQPWVAHAANVGLVPFLVCILASMVSLILRYRRSGGVERQQIKWIALAASVVGLGFVGAMVSGLIAFVLTPEAWEDSAPLWFDLLFTGVLLSFGGVPVAVGIAVTRYRLYDIDLLINRTLVYGSLTAMLVALYFGSVVSLQAALRVLTGQESTLAIVASTLTIAALFSPLRRRVQRSVDRRFYRRKYDAAKTLAAFNARLRQETDLDALSDDLVGVARATVQPEHASLWLRSETASGDQWTD